MTPREWTTLGFRLLGILIVINGLASLPWSLVSLGTPWSGEAYGVTWTQFVLLLVAAFAPTLMGLAMLARTDWFVDKAFASVLARYDAGEMAESEEAGEARGADAGRELAAGAPVIDDARVSPGAPDAFDEDGADDAWVLDFPSLERDDVLAIAFSIAGVVVLVSAIPDAVMIVAALFRESRSELAEMFNIFAGDAPQPLLFVAARLAIGLWLFFRSYGIVALWARSQRRRPRLTGAEPV